MHEAKGSGFLTYSYLGGPGCPPVGDTNLELFTHSGNFGGQLLCIVWTRLNIVISD